MRGPKPNNPIQLVDKEIAQLEKLISAHKTPQAKVRRATVILLAHQHPEWSNQELGRAAGLTTTLGARVAPAMVRNQASG